MWGFDMELTKNNILNSFDFSNYKNYFHMTTDQIASKARNIKVLYDSVYFTITDENNKMGLFKVRETKSTTECLQLLPYDRRRIVKIFSSDELYIAETENKRTGKRGIFVNEQFFLEEEWDEIVKDKRLRFFTRNGSLWGCKDITWSNYPIPAMYDEINYQAHSFHNYDGKIERIPFVPFLETYNITRNNKKGAICYFSKRGIFGIFTVPTIFEEAYLWNCGIADEKPYIFFKVKTEEGYNFFEATENRLLSDDFFDSITDVDISSTIDANNISMIGRSNLLSNSFYGVKNGISYMISDGTSYKINNESKVLSKRIGSNQFM